MLHYFIGGVARSPDATLFQGPEGVMTYGDAAVRVVSALQTFDNVGLIRGDRVICYAEQTIPLALMLLTSGIARVLPVPISPVFSPAYLTTLCRQAGARAIYTTPELCEEVANIGLPVICYAGKGVTSADKYHPIFAPDPNLSDGEALYDLEERLESFDDLGNAPFLIQATSGSTGAPKLVLRKHAAFNRYAQFVGDEIARGWNLDRPPRFLAANALTHAFAGHMLALALRFGAELLVPEGLDLNINLKALRALDPDILPMTPRVIRSFVLQQQAMKEPPGTHLFGPSAKLHLTAGGRGDVRTMNTLRSQGIEIIEFYGSSEASLVSVTPYGKWQEGVSGRPVADVTLKIGSGGELLVASPGLMAEYYGDQDLTELMFDEEGFYRTGDLGEIDDDGYLRILGRKRDLFNTVEGTNIYPERIEIMLESLDFVDQVFLVGDGLSYMSAHIVLRQPKDRDTEDSIGALMENSQIGEGLLAAEEHVALYERAGLELARINQRLEIVEQIVAFALYGGRFPPEVYTSLRSGKVRKNRPVFLQSYKPSVELLYSYGLDKNSIHLVPPRERRFRPRVEKMRR